MPEPSPIQSSLRQAVVRAQCVTCRRVTRIRVRDNGGWRERVVNCECVDRPRLHDLFRADSLRWVESITPPVYELREVTDWPELAVFLQGWDWHANLILTGPVGTGKTTAAYSALAYLAREGRLLAPLREYPYWAQRQVVLANVGDYLRERRRSYDGGGDVPPLETAALTILDDLGAERIRADEAGASWAAEQLYLAVNDRWEHRRPTWVTTNCEPRELTERLGARIADRIVGGAQVVEFEGASKRLIRKAG